MKEIVVIATQDGHWLAHCLSSGVVASAKSYAEALAELRRLTSPMVPA